MKIFIIKIFFVSFNKNPLKKLSKTKLKKYDKFNLNIWDRFNFNGFSDKTRKLFYYFVLFYLEKKKRFNQSNYAHLYRKNIKIENILFFGFSVVGLSVMKNLKVDGKEKIFNFGFFKEIFWYKLNEKVLCQASYLGDKTTC